MKYKVSLSSPVGNIIWERVFPYLDAPSNSAKGYVKLFRIAAELRHWDESTYDLEITEVPDDND